jgi:hypothetical protein
MQLLPSSSSISTRTILLLRLYPRATGGTRQAEGGGQLAGTCPASRLGRRRRGRGRSARPPRYLLLEVEVSEEKRHREESGRISASVRSSPSYAASNLSTSDFPFGRGKIKKGPQSS